MLKDDVFVPGHILGASSPIQLLVASVPLHVLLARWSLIPSTVVLRVLVDKVAA